MSKPNSVSNPQRGMQLRSQHGSSPSVSPFRTKIWPKGEIWCARPLGGGALGQGWGPLGEILLIFCSSFQENTQDHFLICKMGLAVASTSQDNGGG